MKRVHKSRWINDKDTDGVIYMPCTECKNQQAVDNLERHGFTPEQALEAINQLNSRLAEVEEELSWYKSGDLHSCHDNCQKPACVQRRRLAEAETVLHQVAPTILWATEYAKAKDVMNSNWHKSPLKYRELTIDLISGNDKVGAYLEKYKGET